MLQLHHRQPPQPPPATSTVSTGILRWLHRPHIRLRVPPPFSTEMRSNNRNYRAWSAEEDAKFIEALLDMVNMKGFKSINGFRPGYLQHLESELKKSLPTSGLTARPHIESRVKTMKKDWIAVYDMLNTSGFGYDKENNCVKADASVWKSYIESHKLASKWQNKLLPHYEEMCVIFGKGRAQGNRAKSVVEMEEDANREELEDQMEEDFDETSHNEGTKASFQVEETSSGRGKKRKHKSQVNSLFEKFNDAVILFGDRLKETSAELSEGIKYELEKEKKTTMITSEIEKMTSLSQLEIFRAIEEIKSDYNRVSTFWDLREEKREAWVRFLLSK